METNAVNVPSAGILWEALKAVLRGYIIQYAAYVKKCNIKDLANLEKEIKLRELEMIRKTTHEGLRYLTQLKYNVILSKKVEFGLFRARQKYFESGDKAGKLMANYIKQREMSVLIPAVQSSERIIVTKPVDINEVFRNIYFDLYTSSCKAEVGEIKDFLN